MRIRCSSSNDWFTFLPSTATEAQVKVQLGEKAKARCRDSGQLQNALYVVMMTLAMIFSNIRHPPSNAQGCHYLGRLLRAVRGP